MIKNISIEGYKSIRKLDGLEFRSLNVLIGANGAGKSNFISFFRLLREMVEQRLQLAVGIGGGADAFLFMGQKVTKEIKATFQFGQNAYEFALIPTQDGRLIFGDEKIVFFKSKDESFPKILGQGHAESRLKGRKDDSGLTASRGPAHYVYGAIAGWVVYHFHDTSATAGVRLQKAINDNEFLRQDGENLAAFLLKLRKTAPLEYQQIRDVVRLAVPFFDDFKLRPVVENPEMTWLEWTQRDSDYPFRPSQLSDGTLRFMCLAAALLQPRPPATMIFDEPELGLHPYALTLLSGLVKKAAKRFKQIIVCTQSAALLNEFEPEDVIVVDRQQGQSIFHRLNKNDLTEWLENYGLGELWQKNVFGGRPHSEASDMPPDDGPPPSSAFDAPGAAPPEDAAP